jgi:hypothetical protein
MHDPTAAHVLISLTQAEWPSATAPIALPELDAWCASRRMQAWGGPREGDSATAVETCTAQALGLAVQARQAIPWAAWHAQRLGLDTALPAALITPCHWDINMTGARMDDPADLMLSDTDSQALMQALSPWAEEDGIALHWLDATHWLAQGEVFRDLRGPSPASVAGQALDHLLPEVRQNAEATRLLRRLQNEAQMLFYSHPVHDARAAQRLPAVNSIWYHGCGPWTPTQSPAQAVHTHALRDALRAHDGDWTAAWQMLAEQAMAHLNAAPQARLLISHAAGAWVWGPEAKPWWQRWGGRSPGVLETLRCN